MQAVMMTLPEFDPLESDPEPAPVRRPGYFFFLELGFDILCGLFQCGTVLHGSTLLAGI